MSISEDMANYRHEYKLEHGKYPESVTLHVNKYMELKVECEKVMLYIRQDAKDRVPATFMGMRVDVLLEDE